MGNTEVIAEQKEISELKKTNKKIGKILWLRGISKIQKQVLRSYFFLIVFDKQKTIIFLFS